MSWTTRVPAASSTTNSYVAWPASKPRAFITTSDGV